MVYLAMPPEIGYSLLNVKTVLTLELTSHSVVLENGISSLGFAYFS